MKSLLDKFIADLEKSDVVTVLHENSTVGVYDSGKLLRGIKRMEEKVKPEELEVSTADFNSLMGQFEMWGQDIDSQMEIEFEHECHCATKCENCSCHKEG